MSSDTTWLLLAAGGAAGLLLLRARGGSGAGSGPQYYLTADQRDARFGPIGWTPAPTASNPEAVNVTASPPMVSVLIPSLGKSVKVHEKAAPSLRAVLADLRKNGQEWLIRSLQGTYNPRLVRGSDSTLSSHAYATAIDLNADTNPVGSDGTSEQWALASVFYKHGWWWGGWFTRKDPMHFEFMG